MQQRSAVKSLKFEQFLTTSTSFNAENDRTVGDSYDILGGSTHTVARKNSSTEGSKFAALIGKCAVIGLIKQPIRFSRCLWGRKIV